MHEKIHEKQASRNFDHGPADDCLNLVYGDPCKNQNASYQAAVAGRRCFPAVYPLRISADPERTAARKHDLWQLDGDDIADRSDDRHPLSDKSGEYLKQYDRCQCGTGGYGCICQGRFRFAGSERSTR